MILFSVTAYNETGILILPNSPDIRSSKSGIEGIRTVSPTEQTGGVPFPSLLSNRFDNDRAATNAISDFVPRHHNAEIQNSQFRLAYSDGSSGL
jgi:hypothetical protein